MISDYGVTLLEKNGHSVPEEHTHKARPSFLAKLFCLHNWEFVEYMDKVPASIGGFFHTGSGHVCSKCNAQKYS